MSELKKTEAADNDTKDRLLAAAKDLFFSKDFNSVTTDMIAHAGSMSKSTIYKFYRSKDDLFAAVINAESERFGADALESFETYNDFRMSLQTYGENLLEFISLPSSCRFERMMMCHADEHTDTVRLFFDNAYLAAEERVTELIELAKKSGHIETKFDSRRLADFLLSMWRGREHVARQYALDQSPRSQIAFHVGECIEVLFGPDEAKS
ncbi:MAG: TetR/AcrR family transcriptional regulator [Pseudomonadota bacterium]